ncbi:Na+/H+ antiporter subunit C [Thermomonas brevis]
MELAMASAIGILTGAGVYLLLRARSFDVILGLTLLSYATNLLIFSAGGLVIGKPPVLRDGVAHTLAHHTDPLPQALVLTAIVIAFAMTAVSIVLAIRSRGDLGSDHVDGGEAEQRFRAREQRRHQRALEQRRGDDDAPERGA